MAHLFDKSKRILITTPYGTDLTLRTAAMRAKKARKEAVKQSQQKEKAA